MSLTLYLNRHDWFQHMKDVEEQFPDYIPVIKGNGYGFGNEFLADAAVRTGKKSIAVGTLAEARALDETHAFDEMLILTPVLKNPGYNDMGKNRVYTVGSVSQLKHLIDTFSQLMDQQQSIWSGGEAFQLQILIKCQSYMKRYGFSSEEWAKVQSLIKEHSEGERLQLVVKGYSIHFPREGMTAAQKEKQIRNWIQLVNNQGLPCEQMYVSHLSSEQYRILREEFPKIRFRIRLGTDLWLHDKSFFQTKTTVLDVKKIQKGERFGYKQTRAKKRGHLVFVAGGTANGVGLEAPAMMGSMRDRVKLTAFWFLHFTNRLLSPFTYQGKRIWFAEPPHMQTSVLFFPEGSKVPELGEELEVQLRMTTATFDQCVELGKANEAETEIQPDEKIQSKQEEKGKALNALS